MSENNAAEAGNEGNMQVPLGEIWESFHIEGHKVGFMRRLTSAAEQPGLLTSKLHVMFFAQGGIASFKHEFTFYNKAGYPPHSYLFDTNDGAPVHVRFSGNQMVCQVDEEIFTEPIPADARPTYGYYPHVVTIPFRDGHKIPFTPIIDSSCTVQARSALVGHGWDNVSVGNQIMRLWLVGEQTDGRMGNRYWLDEQRRIRQSCWQGAMTYWVPTREEALSGLPAALIEYVKESFDTSNDSDWTSEIVEWLSQDLM
jgi:hypothetical protein